MKAKQTFGIVLIGLSAAILIGATTAIAKIDASILTLEPNATRLPLMAIPAVALFLAIIGVALNLDVDTERAKWVGSAWLRLGFCTVFGAIAIYSLLLVNRSGGPEVQRINGVLVEYSHGAIGRKLTEEEAANSLRGFGQLWLGLTAWMSLLALLLAPIGIEIMRARLQQKVPKTGAKDNRTTP
jgi:membrane protease YdiL (CAAX protease family)